jgi:hypothetical protein
MRLFYFTPILFSLTVLLSCNNRKTNNDNGKNSNSEKIQALKKFYYPFDELANDGLVYEYVDDSLGAVVDYWLFKTVKDEAGDRFLIGAGYNALFEQRYFSREWIVANGTILKDYRFIQTDNATKISKVRPAVIEESVIFPFDPVKDNSLAYRFRIKFNVLPDTAMNYDLVRDRKFDKFLEYDFNGKKIAAVQFKAKEYIEAKDSINGGHWTINSEMTEIYAEGIGLVYTEKKGKGANFKNRLNKRMTPKEFESLQITKNK